jgi:signal transduction histidine kinase
MMFDSFEYLILSFVLGSVFIVLAYHAAIYIVLRDSLYLYFCFYLIAVLFFLVSSSFFIESIFGLTFNEIWHFTIHEALSQFMFGTYILYVTKAFDYRKQDNPLIWKLSKVLKYGIIIYVVIFIVFAALGKIQWMLFYFNRAFLFFISIALIFNSFKIRGNPVLKYIQIATLIYYSIALSSFIVLLFDINLGDHLPLLLLCIAIWIDLIIFSLALAKRSHIRVQEAQKKVHEQQFELQTLQYQHKSRLQDLQSKERMRISMDLHDDLGATITSLKFITSAGKKDLSGEASSHFKRYQRIEHISNQVLDTISDLILSLSSSENNLGTLETKISDFIFECNQQNAIKYSIDICDKEIQLDMPNFKNLWLIIKEAINNIHKHSGATSASISIKTLLNNLQLSIIDNGTGIKPSGISGNGLKNIQNRVKLLHGSLITISNSIEGTRHIIEFPIPNISD